MDAANTIFQTAKRRCYISSGKTKDKEKEKEKGKEAEQMQYDIDFVDDEDAWAALDEVEGRLGHGSGTNYSQKWVSHTTTYSTTH